MKGRRRIRKSGHEIERRASEGTTRKVERGFVVLLPAPHMLGVGQGGATLTTSVA
jgi:hypothetical protein